MQSTARLKMLLPNFTGRANEMENSISDIKAPSTVPGNDKGTLAGAVATLAVGLLTNSGYLSTVAVALGMSEATLSILAMTVVGAVANYLITHVSGIKSYADLYAALPSVYAEYPETKKPSGTTKTNLKDNHGNQVNSGA